MSRRIKDILFILAGVILGTGVSLTTTLVLAHGGDTSKLHACVDDTTGALRIVGENDACPGGEHNVDWDQDAVASVGEHKPPFVCSFKCYFSDFPEKFKGKDFTNAFIRQLQLMNVDMSDTNFSSSVITGGQFTGSDLSNSDFSNSNVSSTSFQNTTLASTNFTAASAEGTGFQNANLTNGNFTNANFTYADFTGATNMDTTTLTGVTWDNTICPDGTNSNDNGNTCVGHLTP